jgi:predicted dienelactone hydrolase
MKQDYDPFIAGPFTVLTSEFETVDLNRQSRFPCALWCPAEAGRYPLVIYSHPSTFHRKAATFLCTHLTSHGYLVAAMDHSESVVPELKRPKEETAEQQAARWQAAIDSRVPDVRLLLERVLDEQASRIEFDHVGIVGHSFGGWTALAAPEVEPRIRSVVALAPAGASNPRPGILPATLTFKWKSDVPTLYLVAENDVALPLAGMYELFERTRAAKRMLILRRADHAHFMDNVEQMHETARTAPATGDYAAMQNEMLPITELCSGEQAHLFVRGITLAHFDATLKGRAEARHFLDGDVQSDLARRGIDAIT